MNTKAIFAVIFGASIWGLFWIPLRQLESIGFGGLWAVTLSLCGAAGISLLFSIFKAKPSHGDSFSIFILAAGIGSSTILYFVAVMISDVVRVVLLFYMLPLWASLFSWIISREPLGYRRALALLVSFFGLSLLLGGGNLPVPQDLGDYCGLAAGVLWGLSLALLRGNPKVDPFKSTSAIFCFAFVVSLVAALALNWIKPSPLTVLPSLDVWLVAAPIALGFGCVALWPSMLGQVWGARYLPAAFAALLTMSEILVATVSAWLLIGTQLSTISVVGGIFIVIAALAEIHFSKKF